MTLAALKPLDWDSVFLRRIMTYPRVPNIIWALYVFWLKNGEETIHLCPRPGHIPHRGLRSWGCAAFTVYTSLLLWRANQRPFKRIGSLQLNYTYYKKLTLGLVINCVYLFNIENQI